MHYDCARSSNAVFSAVAEPLLVVLYSTTICNILLVITYYNITIILLVLNSLMVMDHFSNVRL